MAIRNALLPQGLARRLAIWVALSTALSLCVFAAIAFVVVIADEYAEPEGDAPEDILNEARTQVGKSMSIAAPICLSLAVIGAVISARRALRPLNRVIETAARLTSQQLHERLPIPEQKDEVHALVVTLNDLLARLESGFAALDQFAADASHELRTPLTVIATELEVMLQNPRSAADWEKSARLCLDESRHLTQLITVLLEMARVERGVAPATSGVSLRVMLERAVSVVAPSARSRNVALHSLFGDETDRTSRGDSDALSSALVNVLDNAVRYTGAGGEVRIWSDAPSDEAVVVHVDDSGAGIDTGERRRIFEPFTRGSASRMNTGGLGLGLAIARRICEHNEVTLGVDRSPSGGARFSFRFTTLASDRDSWHP